MQKFFKFKRVHYKFKSTQILIKLKPKTYCFQAKPENQFDKTHTKKQFMPDSFILRQSGFKKVLDLFFMSIVRFVCSLISGLFPFDWRFILKSTLAFSDTHGASFLISVRAAFAWAAKFHFQFYLYVGINKEESTDGFKFGEKTRFLFGLNNIYDQIKLLKQVHHPNFIFLKKIFVDVSVKDYRKFWWDIL